MSDELKRKRQQIEVYGLSKELMFVINEFRERMIEKYNHKERNELVISTLVGVTSYFINSNYKKAERMQLIHNIFDELKKEGAE